MSKGFLYKGDCLEVMSKLPDGCVDAIICDPPYGTTACKWDTIIPLELMWKELWRIVKVNHPVVIFGQEPFSSFLRVSCVDNFKYDFYWKKSRPSGFVNAKLKPLKDIEIISVFSEGTTANGSNRNMPYNPQNVGEGILWSRPKNYEGQKGVSPSRNSHKLKRKTGGSNYPRQILEFSNPNRGLVHPTQKPLELMEYLVKTYTNEGDRVLDFTMGSGTTGVACKNLKRSFIGIERDEEYFEIAKKRIEDA